MMAVTAAAGDDRLHHGFEVVVGQDAFGVQRHQRTALHDRRHGKAGAIGASSVSRRPYMVMRAL